MCSSAVVKSDLLTTPNTFSFCSLTSTTLSKNLSCLFLKLASAWSSRFFVLVFKPLSSALAIAIIKSSCALETSLKSSPRS